MSLRRGARRARSGVCPLCEKERPLCLSHVIPAFFWKDVFDEAGRSLELSVDRERLVQRGIKDRERLLCECCEKLLNEHYETPISRWWPTAGSRGR